MFGSGAVVDFGLAAGASPDRGWRPVAAATGTFAVPAKMRARNCGTFTKCAAAVVDGVLYVRPKAVGVIIGIQ